MVVNVRQNMQRSSNGPEPQRYSRASASSFISVDLHQSFFLCHTPAVEPP
jgi:hypothetical protein